MDKINPTTYKKVAKDNPKDLLVLEVGDSKDLKKFQPQVKVCRWGDTENDNECNVSIRLKETPEELLETPTITEKDGKIEYKKSKREAHFYDALNGSEFDVVFKEKPATNVVEFSLNTKGVHFLHQPDITPEELAGGGTRPENARGSYAVYTTQRINIVGGKEYKTGKVGHIFRPKVTDADNNEIWGVLDIIGDRLTITIDRDWLDKAVYPVVVDPNFGYETQGASNMNTGLMGYSIAAGPVVCPAGNLTSIKAYMAKVGAQIVRVNATAYTSAAGTNLPSARMCVSAYQDVDAVGWYTFDVADTALTQDALISLATYAASYEYTYYYDLVGTGGSYFDGEYMYGLNGQNLPNPFGTATFGATCRMWSIYGVADGAAATKALMGNSRPDASAYATASVWWKKFVAPSDMTVSSVFVFCDNQEAAVNTVHAAVYSHDAANNAPQACLAKSTSAVNIAASTAAFVGVTLSSSVSLTAGTTYWLAGQFSDGTNCNLRYTSAIGSYYLRKAYAFGAFPDPALDTGYDGSGQTRVPIYCLGDTAAAAGPANLKSRSGNLKANIKSMSGNLIANIKSLSGNS